MKGNILSWILGAPPSCGKQSQIATLSVATSVSRSGTATVLQNIRRDISRHASRLASSCPFNKRDSILEIARRSILSQSRLCSEPGSNRTPDELANKCKTLESKIHLHSTGGFNLPQVRIDGIRMEPYEIPQIFSVTPPKRVLG